MDANLPAVISCAVRDNKDRVCGAGAQYETYNPAQQHAFYRCLKPECRGVSVACYNVGHVQ